MVSRSMSVSWPEVTKPHRYYLITAISFDELIRKVNELIGYDAIEGESWHPLGGVLILQSPIVFYQTMEYRA